MTRQKIFFISLFLLGSLTSGYFTFRAAGALLEYAFLKEKAPARIERWEVKETGGKFPISAAYSFEAKGRAWQGTTQFAEPWHLNEDSAILALKEKANRSWTAWYRFSDPSMSSLERAFPTGLVIRTLISYGVFAYFIFLFRKIIKIIIIE